MDVNALLQGHPANNKNKLLHLLTMSKMPFSPLRFGQFCDFHPKVCFFRIWV
ncbi:hypothetical protein Hanom_Chr12g01157301 [Helianthus anomalus]